MITNVVSRFFLNSKKGVKEGKMPLYLRLTVNSERCEISLRKWLIPGMWDQYSQTVRGKSEEAKELNSYLLSLKASLQRIQNAYFDKKEPLTAALLKNELLGITAPVRTLLEVFREHNGIVRQSVGKMFSKRTADHYTTSMDRLTDFIRQQYKADDIALNKLDKRFILHYDKYLRTTHNCAHNTAMKYLKQLKKVVHLAQSFGYLESDPFDGYKTAFKEANRGYLTREELDRIEKHRFLNRRLDVVRDLFLFVCYTGISYSDLKNLTHQNIVKGIDGKDWLVYERQKTGIKASVPLLPVALSILEKYREDSECIDANLPLPVRSNQKLNSYLEEIADVCSLSRVPTMHVGRHTFATTVTLANGVPITSVQKMLAHKFVQTTQIYSKVLDTKVAEDMEKVQKRLYGNGESHIAGEQERV